MATNSALFCDKTDLFTNRLAASIVSRMRPCFQGHCVCNRNFLPTSP